MTANWSLINWFKSFFKTKNTNLSDSNFINVNISLLLSFFMTVNWIFFGSGRHLWRLLTIIRHFTDQTTHQLMETSGGCRWSPQSSHFILLLMLLLDETMDCSSSSGDNWWLKSRKLKDVEATQQTNRGISPVPGRDSLKGYKNVTIFPFLCPAGTFREHRRRL